MTCTECNGKIKSEPVPGVSGCRDLGINIYVCEDCGAGHWGDNSPVVNGKTGDRVYFKDGKIFSRNDKGEMKTIKIT
jgi:hypothetical protein